MFAEKIPVDRIDLAKTDPQYRTFCKAFAERLADSIKADGLAHPSCSAPTRAPRAATSWCAAATASTP
jgi:hypothetical protein